MEVYVSTVLELAAQMVTVGLCLYLTWLLCDYLKSKALGSQTFMDEVNRLLFLVHSVSVTLNYVLVVLVTLEVKTNHIVAAGFAWARFCQERWLLTHFEAFRYLLHFLKQVFNV